MGRFVIDAVDEFPAGSRRVVEAAGRAIGIYNRGGQFFALRNVCPHHGAPLCTHELRGTMVADSPGEYRYEMDEEIVRCPWHGYEFTVADGRSLLAPDRYRVKTYRIEIEDDAVVLYT